MSNEDKEYSNKKYLTNKDFVYWIIYLSSIIVFLLVWKWDDEQQLTNQISLVGSVSSILLALVAIGYAFFQSQTSSKENNLMLQTLLKINNEIDKLETVNNSLSSLRIDFSNMKDESSIFQGKIEDTLKNLKVSLKDESWLDSVETESGEKISNDLKEKLKENYTSHIERNLEKAFQVDNEMMAYTLSYIYNLNIGEKIDEKKLKKYLTEKLNTNVNGFDVFNELQKLNNIGIVSLVVNDNDPEKKVFAIKMGHPELLIPSKEE